VGCWYEKKFLDSGDKVSIDLLEEESGNGWHDYDSIYVIISQPEAMELNNFIQSTRMSEHGRLPALPWSSVGSPNPVAASLSALLTREKQVAARGACALPGRWRSFERGRRLEEEVWWPGAWPVGARTRTVAGGRKRCGGPVHGGCSGRAQWIEKKKGRGKPSHFVV
jgi:hypothetical protein